MVPVAVVLAGVSVLDAVVVLAVVDFASVVLAAVDLAETASFLAGAAAFLITGCFSTVFDAAYVSTFALAGFLSSSITTLSVFGAAFY